jgi:hypothetical protein
MGVRYFVHITHTNISVNVDEEIGDEARRQANKLPGTTLISIEIKELERVEIHFFAPKQPTLNVENRTLNNITPLPIGSTLDSEEGIFSWQPGPGFIGEYRFVFVSGDQQGHKTRKDVRVIIRPEF